MKTLGLLVMAYGTPYKPEDIERYYTHIRRGRKPSPEALAELTERYEAIGGVSPLAQVTIDQAEELHGITEAVTVVLAPHYSTFSIRSYNGRAKEVADQHGIRLASVESWYKEEAFLDWWGKEIRKTFDALPVPEEKAVLVVSAHSLPEKIIANGDPYPEQLKETAELIAQRAGVPHMITGWQSAGQTPEPWLGPDVQDLTRDVYEEKGYEAFVYVPVGFVADHLEVLFDNDYECKVVCDELGIHYARPVMPNADPAFMKAVTEAVAKQVGSYVQ